MSIFSAIMGKIFHPADAAQPAPPASPADGMAGRAMTGHSHCAAGGYERGLPGMTIAGRQPLTGKLPGRPKAMNVYAGRRRSRNGSMTTCLPASPRMPDRPRGGLR